ncbi:MAG TPA: FAD:protein FMN transferase [Thermoanaerobaculia bacterium]|nr:FAD:protein FMN transferase [Thermoanaerobaculia bacterium]
MRAATALIALALVPITASAVEVSRARYLMGTVCEITLDGDPPAVDAAFAEAARIESFLSTWRDDSELSRVNRGEAEASAELRSLLDRAIAWRDQTGGAFDPQIRPLLDVWRTRSEGSVPSRTQIEAAIAIVRTHRGPFEEGAFGKGYAMDRMLSVIASPHVVINFGGQISVRGASRVSIADPLRRDVPMVNVTLRDASLSTSSGSEKTFVVDGRTFTHIFDPRTGEALPPRGSVSVIAQDALTADILSTALYVMGPDEGLRWANAHHIAALFVTPSHQIFKSNAFPKE